MLKIVPDMFTQEQIDLIAERLIGSEWGVGLAAAITTGDDRLDILDKSAEGSDREFAFCVALRLLAGCPVYMAKAAVAKNG